MTRFTSLALAGAALAVLAEASAPSSVHAQDETIDFGDDASVWSNDRECDDPRFEGPGMAVGLLLDEDRGHDATDCRTAYDAGRVTFLGGALDAGADTAGLDTPAIAPDAPDAVIPFLPTASDVDVDDIDFGDDSSVWANDGECDDPRFTGPGVAVGANRSNARRDASDCRAVMDSGQASFTGDLEELFTGSYDGIEFGDNSGPYADDGECDDPRFAGAGVAFAADRSGAQRDAADCRAAYDAGEADFVGDLDPPFEGLHDGIDFGANTGSFPFDNECDDPRFSGANVAFGASRENVMADADDCRRAYDDGLATYEGELESLFEGSADGIDFGDNSGPYADDDECDDPRFSGSAVAAGPRREHVRQDAHDCHEAYQAGTASFDGELEPLFSGVYEGVDFGNNEGPFADDGECDDRRFRGFGMASTPWSGESEYRDAADCQALYAKGFVRFVAADGLFAGQFQGVDFGDNSGGFANDGECDDSRFEGPGMGSDSGDNDFRDAMDCKTNFEEGSIILRE